MSIPYRHYVAGAQLVADFEDHQKKKEAHIRASEAWASQWNAKPVYQTGDGGLSVIGIFCDADPGKDWKLSKHKLPDGQGYYIPNTRRKEGKNNDRDMYFRKWHRWHIPELKCEIISTGLARGQAFLCSGYWERISGVLVIAVPEQSEWKPKDDSRLLKMSEYYQMKELAEAAANEAGQQA